MTQPRPYAVVTGASTGIGYELAACCARHGFDVLVVADEPEIVHAAQRLRAYGTQVEAIEADLGTLEGVERTHAATRGRPVDALFANAGRGLGGGFLEQDFQDVLRIIQTNVTGTAYLVHRIGRDMWRRGHGRILITGSIAGFVPGTFHAIYNASKAFIDSFAAALRNELKDSGVSVTCLMPGATETKFFERARMLDTKIGRARKDSAQAVARQGFDAAMKGRDGIITGWKNKLTVLMARLLPSRALAEQHRDQSQPDPRPASNGRHPA